MWVAYSIVWLSMALAVSTGIVVTGKWTLLWFMIIPGLVSLHEGADVSNSGSRVGAVANEEESDNEKK